MNVRAHFRRGWQDTKVLSKLNGVRKLLVASYFLVSREAARALHEAETVIGGHSCMQAWRDPPKRIHWTSWLLSHSRLASSEGSRMLQAQPVNNPTTLALSLMIEQLQNGWLGLPRWCQPRAPCIPAHRLSFIHSLAHSFIQHSLWSSLLVSGTPAMVGDSGLWEMEQTGGPLSTLSAAGDSCTEEGSAPGRSF